MPSSMRPRTSAAVNVFETLAIGNAVPGVTRRPAATSARPAAPFQTEPSANRMVADMPGMPALRRRASSRASSAARTSGVALAVNRGVGIGADSRGTRERRWVRGRRRGGRLRIDRRGRGRRRRGDRLRRLGAGDGSSGRGEEGCAEPNADHRDHDDESEQGRAKSPIHEGRRRDMLAAP